MSNSFHLDIILVHIFLYNVYVYSLKWIGYKQRQVQEMALIQKQKQIYMYMYNMYIIYTTFISTALRGFRLFVYTSKL